MHRAVVDPGVLVAALLSPQGTPAKLIHAWLEGRFELIVSPKLLEELRRVLERPKFRQYATQQESLAYVEGLRRLATVVDDPRVTRGVTRDPSDDYLVALAQSAKAHCLVSGDEDLTKIELRPPVLTPRSFLALLKEP